MIFQIGVLGICGFLDHQFIFLITYLFLLRVPDNGKILK
jgi:hypothetical protein